VAVNSSPPGPEDARAGLCAGCAHVRRIASSRGSIFYRCERSATDARFPRYPRLPVLQCAGYAPRSVGPPADEPDRIPG